MSKFLGRGAGLVCFEQERYETGRPRSALKAKYAGRFRTDGLRSAAWRLNEFAVQAGPIELETCVEGQLAAGNHGERGRLYALRDHRGSRSNTHFERCVNFKPRHVGRLRFCRLRFCRPGRRLRASSCASSGSAEYALTSRTFLFQPS